MLYTISWECITVLPVHGCQRKTGRGIVVIVVFNSLWKYHHSKIKQPNDICLLLIPILRSIINVLCELHFHRKILIGKDNSIPPQWLSITHVLLMLCNLQTFSLFNRIKVISHGWLHSSLYTARFKEMNRSNFQ